MLSNVNCGFGEGDKMVSKRSAGEPLKRRAVRRLPPVRM